MVWGRILLGNIGQALLGQSLMLAAGGRRGWFGRGAELQPTAELTAADPARSLAQLTGEMRPRHTVFEMPAPLFMIVLSFLRRPSTSRQQALSEMIHSHNQSQLKKYTKYRWHQNTARIDVNARDKENISLSADLQRVTLLLNAEGRIEKVLGFYQTHERHRNHVDVVILPNGSVIWYDRNYAKFLSPLQQQALERLMEEGQGHLTELLQDYPFILHQVVNPSEMPETQYHFGRLLRDFEGLIRKLEAMNERMHFAVFFIRDNYGSIGAVIGSQKPLPEDWILAELSITLNRDLSDRRESAMELNFAFGSIKYDLISEVEWIEVRKFLEFFKRTVETNYPHSTYEHKAVSNDRVASLRSMEPVVQDSSDSQQRPKQKTR